MNIYLINTSDALELINLLISGLIATSVMTLLMYLGGIISGKNLAVIHILGSMITFNTKVGGGVSKSFLSFITGFVLHFLVGIFYAFIYAWLWSINIGKPNFINSIIFGSISGIIAIIGWNIFIKIHPKPPAIPIREYMVALFFTHIIFAVILFYIYLVLARYPLPLT
jgi:hypothetical protein